LGGPASIVKACHCSFIYLRQRRRYMFSPVRPSSSVCLSVCLSVCMDLDEILRVHGCSGGGARGSDVPLIISEGERRSSKYWNRGGETLLSSAEYFFDHFLSKIVKNIADFYVNNHLCDLINLKPLINCFNSILAVQLNASGDLAQWTWSSQTCSSLLVSNVSSLMFLKLHRPPLATWKPSSYVKTWLLKHEASDDNRTRIAVPTYEADKLNRTGPLVEHLVDCGLGGRSYSDCVTVYRLLHLRQL